MTFGQIVAEARKKSGLSQKELAARITKEDGSPISPQYLNDVERDRRNPPSEYLIGEFARQLNLDPDGLYMVAGQMPPDLRDGSWRPEQVQRAFVAFRTEIHKEPR